MTIISIVLFFISFILGYGLCAILISGKISDLEHQVWNLSNKLLELENDIREKDALIKKLKGNKNEIK